MRPQMQQERDAPLEIVVPPGDCRFSTDPNCRLITRRVDSDVALAVHVPKLKLAALLRFVASDSAMDRAEKNPWMFADTAIPLLFARLRAIGLKHQDLLVYAIGGAASIAEDGSSISGKSNDLAMRRLLWREGVLLRGEDTGGTVPRSVWLEAATGRIIVRTQPCVRAGARATAGAEICHFAS